MFWRDPACRHSPSWTGSAVGAGVSDRGSCAPASDTSVACDGSSFSLFLLLVVLVAGWVVSRHSEDEKPHSENDQPLLHAADLSTIPAVAAQGAAGTPRRHRGAREPKLRKEQESAASCRSGLLGSLCCSRRLATPLWLHRIGGRFTDKLSRHQAGDEQF